MAHRGVSQVCGRCSWRLHPRRCIRKKIALVFTGDSFGDGGATIRQTLEERNVKASFFLTGNFYSNASYQSLINHLSDLKDGGHYLGAHSDKHLLYADWTNRDSLLVTKEEFKDDILANYQRMASFGIEWSDARWFLPPYEWYNATIAQWLPGSGNGSLSTA